MGLKHRKGVAGRLNVGRRGRGGGGFDKSDRRNVDGIVSRLEQAVETARKKAERVGVGRAAFPCKWSAHRERGRNGGGPGVVSVQPAVMQAMVHRRWPRQWRWCSRALRCSRAELLRRHQIDVTKGKRPGGFK